MGPRPGHVLVRARARGRVLVLARARGRVLVRARARGRVLVRLAPRHPGRARAACRSAAAPAIAASSRVGHVRAMTGPTSWSELAWGPRPGPSLLRAMSWSSSRASWSELAPRHVLVELARGVVELAPRHAGRAPRLAPPNPGGLRSVPQLGVRSRRWARARAQAAECACAARAFVRARSTAALAYGRRTVRNFVGRSSASMIAVVTSIPWRT